MKNIIPQKNQKNWSDKKLDEESEEMEGKLKQCFTLYKETNSPSPKFLQKMEKEILPTLWAERNEPSFSFLRWFQWLLAALVPATAALLFFTHLNMIKKTQDPTVTVSTGKGNLVSFECIHSHAMKFGHTQKNRTRSGSILYPNDLIKFTYQLAEKSYIMIVSINEEGELSIYAPLGGRESLLVEAGSGHIPAKGSLELDGYVGKEQILILHAKRSFSFKQVKRALRGTFKADGRQLKKRTYKKQTWNIVKSLLIQKKINPLSHRKQRLAE